MIIKLLHWRSSLHDWMSWFQLGLSNDTGPQETLVVNASSSWFTDKTWLEYPFTLKEYLLNNRCFNSWKKKYKFKMCYKKPHGKCARQRERYFGSSLLWYINYFERIPCFLMSKTRKKRDSSRAKLLVNLENLKNNFIPSKLEKSSKY